MLTFNQNNGKYKNWRSPKVEIFELCFDPLILLIFLMKKHMLFKFLTLKWLNYMHFLFWPSESPSYNYVHLKFLIFIESIYFVHMMITRGVAVQFSKTVVTLPSVLVVVLLHVWSRWSFSSSSLSFKAKRFLNSSLSKCASDSNSLLNCAIWCGNLEKGLKEHSGLKDNTTKTKNANRYVDF